MLWINGKIYLMKSTIKEYSKFLERLGHLVYIDGEYILYNPRKYFFQQVLNFLYEPPNIQKRKDIFSSIKAIGIRYFIIDKKNPKSRYGVYLAYPPYDISSISKKARNQVRRGLERVNVINEPISEELIDKVSPVYFENMNRLKIFKKKEMIDRRWGMWKKAILESKICEMWCAYNKDELVAFSLLVFTPSGPEIAMQRMNISHSKLYPNNALVYKLSKSVFQRGAKSLSFGLNKFGETNSSGLDHFKDNMNFKYVGVKEFYIWNPWINPFIKILNLDEEKIAFFHKYLK